MPNWRFWRGPRPRSLGEMVYQHNVWYNNLNGIYAILASNMVQPFLGIYALRLGASNFELAMLSSAPALVSMLVMIPGAILIDRIRDKRKVTSSLILMHRSFFLVLALIPFFTEDIRVTLLVLAVALMNLPGALAGVSWQSYIADIIPAEKRADAFAGRNRLMGIAGTIAVLTTGKIMDMIGFPYGYQLMFSVAFLFALGEVYYFLKIFPPRKRGVSGEVRKNRGFRWQQLLNQKAFLIFCGTSLLFHFGWQMAWPLFTKYQVDYLGATNVWLSRFTVLTTITSILALPYWAKWSNRKGNVQPLAWATLGLAVIPLVYANAHDLRTLGVLSFYSGLMISGVNLLLFNRLLEVVPQEDKTTFIAYYSTLIAFSATIAPLFGVWIMDTWSIKVAFYVAVVIRILGSFAFRFTSRYTA